MYLVMDFADVRYSGCVYFVTTFYSGLWQVTWVDYI